MVDVRSLSPVKVISFFILSFVPLMWIGGIIDRFIYVVVRLKMNTNGEYFKTFLGEVRYGDFVFLYQYGGVTKIIVMALLLLALVFYVRVFGELLKAKAPLVKSNPKLLYLLYIPYIYLVWTQLRNMWMPWIKWYHPFLWTIGIYLVLAVLIKLTGKSNSESLIS